MNKAPAWNDNDRDRVHHRGRDELQAFRFEEQGVPNCQQRVARYRKDRTRLAHQRGEPYPLVGVGGAEESWGWGDGLETAHPKQRKTRILYPCLRGEDINPRFDSI